MKNLNVQLSKRLTILAISLFLFGLSPLYAQIGDLGIYGSAPTPTGTPFPCGTPTKARIDVYPEIDEGFNMTLPLNGLKNFNFYYSEDGNGFLSGGGYRVNYLNSSGTNCYGVGDIAVYTPNGTHTNGVEVRPFAGSLTAPLGVHGTVLAKIPGGGGATTPLVNATAALSESGPLFLWHQKTNGNGYFSIYYSSLNPGEFLPWNPAYDKFKVSGVLQFDRSLTCVYEHVDENGVIWMPNGDYLTSFPMGTIAIESLTPGCEP